MLEVSSLGSESARHVRLEGARVLAGYTCTGAPWLPQAASWPEIAALHHTIADLLAVEGQPERSELWLRAALNRTMNGPGATRLAALLEQRRLTEEAVVWYQRAAETGDPVATARLAVLCHIQDGRELATLVLALGRIRIAPEWLDRADRLTVALTTAGRRRAQLISDCDDGDLLFWVGCALLIADRRDVADECYAAATMTERGHSVAALSRRDLPRRDRQGVALYSLDGALDNLELLVRAAPSGEQAAVESLLSWIRPLVLRYCRARIGSWGKSSISPEDVTQEVCIAVLTALPGYRDQGRPFLAFVYGIAAHKVADAHRLAARHRAEPVSEVPDRPADLAEDPEQRVLQDELAAQLTRLLARLPKKQREILLLRIVVGLSAEETAEMVGSTPGAVRVAQHRALSRLRNLLTSESGREPDQR